MAKTFIKSQSDPVLPPTMSAMVAQDGTATRVNVPVPKPSEGQVLIKVAASGVNRPDLLQAQGRYPPPLGCGPVLGLEVSGIVCAKGDQVSGIAVGDRVAALLSDGGYADYVCAEACVCWRVPEGLSLIEAAAMPEALMTVQASLFGLGRLMPGENLLLYGATSGLGTIALQWAKAAGANVFALAGTAPKLALAQSLGADWVGDYHDAATFTRAKDIGMDVVFDVAGGEAGAQGLQTLKTNGRQVLVGMMDGRPAPIDLTRILLKRLTVTGGTLRSRPLEEKSILAAAVRETAWPLVASGRIRPVLRRVYPLVQAQAALSALDDPQHAGKIVLQCADENSLH